MIFKFFGRVFFDGAAMAKFANPGTLDKGVNFKDRFREIISDPLNLLIPRIPEAGFVTDDEFVILHNGLEVPLTGADSYYREFSNIFIYNRGVHEPLEEFVFGSVIESLRGVAKPTMLELGSYWGMYSMWFTKELTDGNCFLVEASRSNLEAGRRNFVRNGLPHGEFIQGRVGNGGFEIDRFMADAMNDGDLEILHSDIQGAEFEMLGTAESSLRAKRIQNIILSTHSQSIHEDCRDLLLSHGYSISVDSDFDSHTTSHDGLIFAVAKQDDNDSVMPLGRLGILHASPEELLKSLHDVRI